MPSDVENHGRAIWTPFATPSATSGASHGVEQVLKLNIVNSEYYRKIASECDFMAIVDEIYELVDHVEPWMSSKSARGASTGFCLLFRLCEIGLDGKQVAHALRHRDSPYIRAIGFLYCRYVMDGKELLSVFEPYFGDEEKFTPSPNGKEVTMGTFVRDLCLDQHYFETIFPRIPEVARRKLVERIVELGYSDKPLGCGGQGGNRRHNDGSGRPQSVKHALSMQVGRRAPHGQGGGRDGDQGRDDDRRQNYDRRDRSRDRDDTRDRDRDKYKPYVKSYDKYDKYDKYDRRRDH